jgi:hypothetical protein
LRALGRLLLAVALALGLTGCGAGLIYTHVTVPLDLDLHATPAQAGKGRSDWKTFSYVIRVDWDSAEVADAAHEAGLTELYYADMEVTSIFFGLWVQRQAIVYGK